MLSSSLFAALSPCYHRSVKLCTLKSAVVLLTCVFFLFTPAYDVYADELQLENGDYISGHIVSMDEEHVVIQTSYGELTIDRSQVVSGTFSPELGASLEGIAVELLFDGEDDIPEDSSMTITEYGIQKAAGADGTSGSAIRSTGKGTYLKLSGTPDLDSADTITVSFWIFLREATRLQYVLSKWDVTADGETDGKFAVGTRYSALYIYLMDPAGSYHLESFEDIVPTGTWTHVAFVFTSSAITVYKNGVFAELRQVPFGALNESSAPLYIMTAKASTEDRWSRYNLNGMLDNLRIYTRALTETEIADLSEEL